jgi:hypothetical protein
MQNGITVYIAFKYFSVTEIKKYSSGEVVSEK